MQHHPKKRERGTFALTKVPCQADFAICSAQGEAGNRMVRALAWLKNA
jgi:hypothetical protein